MSDCCCFGKAGCELALVDDGGGGCWEEVGDWSGEVARRALSEGEVLGIGIRVRWREYAIRRSQEAVGRE
jgi:hypothetical protein